MRIGIFLGGKAESGTWFGLAGGFSDGWLTLMCISHVAYLTGTGTATATSSYCQLYAYGRRLRLTVSVELRVLVQVSPHTWILGDTWILLHQVFGSSRSSELSLALGALRARHLASRLPFEPPSGSPSYIQKPLQ